MDYEVESDHLLYSYTTDKRPWQTIHPPQGHILYNTTALCLELCLCNFLLLTYSLAFY